jgi:hypothetical protein
LIGTSTAKRIKNLEAVARRRRGKGLPGPFGDPRVYKIRLGKCEGNPYSAEWGFSDVEYLSRCHLITYLLVKALEGTEGETEEDGMLMQRYRAELGTLESLFVELGTRVNGVAWVDDRLAENRLTMERYIPIVKELARREEANLRDEQTY